MRRMADDVMREMNNNLKKKEQQGGNLAMKGEFLAAGIKSEVEGIKSALTDVYKWVRRCWLASTQTNFHSLRVICRLETYIGNIVMRLETKNADWKHKK